MSEFNYRDPTPARITFDEWDVLFQQVPDELIERFRYFAPNQEAWSKYLFPPQMFAIYGARHLRRLKFDNSLAALRMWGFVQNEIERLFRARQMGKEVIAVLGDLGPLAVIVNSFPQSVAFYPDCWWWTPFAMESKVLLEKAAELGIGDATCFSRAALGAFAKHCYFPEPDLVIAATGASCDDYSGVESLVAQIVPEVVWVETPARVEDEAGRERTERMLIGEYQRVINRLEELIGVRLTEEMLGAGVRRANQLRRQTARLRELAYSYGALPGLEMMVVEFGTLHGYSDFQEWQAIVDHLLQTAEKRVREGKPVLGAERLRIGWVTPPADPLLLSYLEDQGARLVATEYVINQALSLLDESIPSLQAIARSLLNASLIGSSAQRAEMFVVEARRRQAEGGIVSGILGGSHCAMESRLLGDYIKKALDIPLLEFDVAPPSKEIDRQTRTRIDAFLELVRSRR